MLFLKGLLLFDVLFERILGEDLDFSRGALLQTTPQDILAAYLLIAGNLRGIEMEFLKFFLERNIELGLFFG
jgi:hypothetical protein